jgi:hypothetical protein
MVFESVLHNRLGYTDLSCLTNDYPEECIPAILRPPTGAKVRKALHEEINSQLYADEAKIAAFRVERQMILPYIQALHLIFENIGKSSHFDVNWYDTPEKWESHCTANAINIDVHTKENTESNPNMLFKVTFFVTTGTVQIQGNGKDSFVSEIFPTLKSLAHNLKQALDSENKAGNRSETSQPDNTDRAETFPKTVEGIIQKSKKHVTKPLLRVGKQTLIPKF